MENTNTNTNTELTIENIETMNLDSLNENETLRVSEFLETELKTICTNDLTDDKNTFQVIETLIESMDIKTTLEAISRLRGM